ncbi:FecR domain-containing protein [Pseudomonas sp. ABC1]|uniref:FecR family protein n=1 Tax=Pseudomonas sp. ABC1 TaxID=2748080 RepID=UPI0015C304D3|nr:FecR domain-containing protein [Pseudomonas sp. ABC1]QLF92984.1 FecR domain-containing protein [Pseudomonas sp. ABC1]
MNDPLTDSALDWLLRLQAAPADQRLRTECEAWQQAAPEHARAWRKAQRVWALSGALPATTATHWPSPTTTTAPRRQNRWRRPLALAACLLLAGIIFLLRPQADIQAPSGPARHMALEDGSQLWLRGGAAVELYFDEQQRRLELLRGDAFFEVKKDTRSFTVLAAGQQVTVTGTGFSVGLGPHYLEVAVAHGSVRVDSQAGTAGLGKGQRWRLDRQSGLAQLDTLPPTQIAAWRNDQLIARDQSIEELLEQVRQHYPGWIILRAPELANRRVTGLYDLSDPRTALQALVTPHGGTVHNWSPYVLVIDQK